MSSRIYADEDVSRHVVDGLRQSHDVLWPSESGETGHSDLWHLQHALTENRVLVTVNHSDFRFLHRVVTSAYAFQGVPSTHAGILSVAQRPQPVEWVSALNSLLSDDDELDGRLLVWHADRDEWLEDAWRPRD